MRGSYCAVDGPAEAGAGAEADAAPAGARAFSPLRVGAYAVLAVGVVVLISRMPQFHGIDASHSQNPWLPAEPTMQVKMRALGKDRCKRGAAAPSFAPGHKGNCSAYKDGSNHCAKDETGKSDECGLCFNPGSRRGVMCPGKGHGYMCDVTKACMDWTFGSTAMIEAEHGYNCRSGKVPVYFGVGTYGVSAERDKMAGLGMCVRMQVEGVDREILAQSINTGHDVSGNQFDLQMGAGGVGAFNDCAGDAASMFPGPKGVWGEQYGGVGSREECADLPPYPRDSAPMKAAGDNLIKLCEYAWDKGVYSNPTILSITRVPCPPELVNITQLRRSDEPPEPPEEAEDAEAKVVSRNLRANSTHKCNVGYPGSGLDWCLTRMMDCRNPSAGVRDNIKPDLVEEGHRLVQACTIDGYTRIDVQCGCPDCYC